MKLRLLLLCFGVLIFALTATASDVIALIDGTSIEGRVEEVTSTVIKYRKASNLSGPIYTIEISTVRNIVYENGSVDTFNSQPSALEVPLQAVAEQSQATELRDSVPQGDMTNGARFISDRELLQMSFGDNHYLKRAKTCRIIGWGGAPVMFGLVYLAGYIWPKDGFHGSDSNVQFACIGAGVAAVWALGWNLRANYLIRQYNNELYSVNIISQDILNIGSNKLTAGVNVMGNRLTHDHTYGLSLALSF